MGEQKQRVHEIMTEGVITVTQDATVQEAVDLMAERNISCVIITEDEESLKPLGIVTERDLIRRILKPGKSPKKTKVKTVMTSSLVTISEQASLEEGMRVMQDMHIRRLPVVSQGTGLITQTDIVEETYNIHKHAQRLAFHQNVQSYVILIILTMIVITVIVKFFRLA